MIPMIAFGIVDQSVLIFMGDIIDNSVGVAFALPTLAAAAMGQVFSDTSGVLFGGAIESIALKLNLPLPGLSLAQQRMTITKVISTAGGVIGVITGCMLGMLNLCFIDLGAAERAKRQKELQSIMSTVMEDGRRVVKCERATLWIVDEDGENIWSSTASGVEHQLRMPISAGVAGYVCRAGETINIPDVGKSELFTSAHQDPALQTIDMLVDFEVKNMLCVPVMRGDKVVGAIQLLNQMGEDGVITAFDSNDRRLAELLATHVSIFMDQADL